MDRLGCVVTMLGSLMSLSPEYSPNKLIYYFIVEKILIMLFKNKIENIPFELKIFFNFFEKKKLI